MKKFNKYRKNNLLLLMFFVIIGCSTSKTALENKSSYYPEDKWDTKLEYSLDEIYPIKLDKTNCPLVEIKINGKPYWLLFDFGSYGGMSITNAIESDIKYTYLKGLKTYNADGSIRGKGKEIMFDQIEVFSKTFDSVKCELFDWKLFSSIPSNGAISLEFIPNTRLTLDYKDKKLAINNKPFPENLDTDNKFEIIQLLKSPDWNKYGLYLLGEVNNKKVVIYIDNGSSHTFIDKRILNEEQISKIKANGYCNSKMPVKIGNMDLVLTKFRVREINRETNYEYPVRMKIGTDLLKYFVITIDRTKDKNLLIIHKL